MESAQFAPYVLFPVEFPWRRSMQRLPHAWVQRGVWGTPNPLASTGKSG